jgi:cytoskeletal protein CcmA (bactofilin family)
MLQSPDNSQKQAPVQNAYVPVKTAGAPLEQATIGRSLVIKGEISGSESLFVDGKVEGSISLPEHRVTIGRNGNVAANVSAKEVVIMGKVHGNVECSDRLDLRSEGSLTGDVTTHRISVEDGAILKGSIQVKSTENKSQNKQDAHKQQEAPKAMAATAGGNA